MSVFVVRQQTSGARYPDLVGIYRAAGPVELAETVSRDCPDQACEYAHVQHGSMYGPDLESAAGAPLYTEATETDVRSVEDLSQDWRELFSDGAPLAWHPVDGASRCLPTPQASRAA